MRRFPGEDTLPAREYEQQPLLAALLTRAGGTGVTARSRVIEGEPAKVLLEAAQHASMLVLVRGGRGIAALDYLPGPTV